MFRFGPYPVIRVCFCVSYNRIAVNNESSRQGQRPRVICIVTRQVDAEPQINASQIFGHGMHQAELSGHLIARIPENLKCQFFGFFQGAAEFVDLGRYGDKICPQGSKLLNMILQSLQLKIAIRSPASAVDGKNHDALRKDIFRAHGLAFGVFQCKMRSLITFF